MGAKTDIAGKITVKMLQLISRMLCAAIETLDMCADAKCSPTRIAVNVHLDRVRAKLIDAREELNVAALVLAAEKPKGHG